MTNLDAPRSRAARPGLAARAFAFLLVASVLVGSGGEVSAAVDDSYKTANGLAIYLGVLPAQMLRGHAPAHQERAMHGGVPGGQHDYHLVVAVFDVQSGARVEDADVTATVSGLGHIAETRARLEPMKIADIVTYGGFVALPSSDRYTITIEIRRTGQEAPTRVDFTYRHGAPAPS